MDEVGWVGWGGFGVLTHCFQDGGDFGVGVWVVAAYHEGGLAEVGGVHVGLGDWGVDELEVVGGEFFAQGGGVEWGG